MAEEAGTWAQADPDGISRILEAADFPWWICGGWALDLYVGSPIRSHGDMDVAILRRDQARLFDLLADWDFRVAESGGTRRGRKAGEWLSPPLHGIWARPSPDEPWTCEFLLNEATDAQWIY